MTFRPHTNHSPCTHAIASIAPACLCGNPYVKVQALKPGWPIEHARVAHVGRFDQYCLLPSRVDFIRVVMDRDGIDVVLFCQVPA